MLTLLPFVIGFGGIGLAAMLRRAGPFIMSLPLPALALAEFWPDRPALAPIVLATGLSGVVLGWVWTYFELSRGRRAYQLVLTPTRFHVEI